jgi:long-subunit acyl-CoA synthetase (AMP-forming)
MKMTDIIYESLAHWGKHPAFIEVGPDKPAVYYSAAEYKEKIDSIKNFLINSGIRKNHIVSLFLMNSVDFTAIFLALIDIGAKPIPMNLAFRTMELDEIFSNANPHAVIAEPIIMPLVKLYSKGVMVFEHANGALKLVAQDDDSLRREPADIADDIASINYTYRGYGYPLGAMIPHSQYIEGAVNIETAVQAQAGMNMLAIMPFWYMFPLVVSLTISLLYKLTTTISSTLNPLHLFDFIDTYKVNVIAAVPEIYELMFNFFDQSSGLPSLTDFMGGGSSITDESFIRITNAFKHVVFGLGYGLTECVPVCSHIRHKARVGTIGPPSGIIECRIASPDQNGAGELEIRTHHMAKAYYRRPNETAEAFDRDWFKTGDIARIEDGHIVFIREKKMTRKVKGNMVDLVEARKALLTCPNVREAVLEHSNNLLSAKIGVDPGIDIEKEAVEIKKFLEFRIARYKIPKVITKL